MMTFPATPLTFEFEGETSEEAALLLFFRLIPIPSLFFKLAVTEDREDIEGSVPLKEEAEGVIFVGIVSQLTCKLKWQRHFKTFKH